MGDKITIKVISGNLAKRQLDYEWVTTGTGAVKEERSAGEAGMTAEGGPYRQGASAGDQRGQGKGGSRVAGKNDPRPHHKDKKFKKKKKNR